jgi:hypothetical protein
MNEHVLAAAFRRDEAKTLGGIEELHGSYGHDLLLMRNGFVQTIAWTAQNGPDPVEKFHCPGQARREAGEAVLQLPEPAATPLMSAYGPYYKASRLAALNSASSPCCLIKRFTVRQTSNSSIIAQPWRPNSSKRTNCG